MSSSHKELIGSKYDVRNPSGSRYPNLIKSFISAFGTILLLIPYIPWNAFFFIYKDIAPKI